MVKQRDTRTMSADEFEVWPRSDAYELIDGHPRLKTMGARASHIQCELGACLWQTVEDAELGELFDSSCPYSGFPSRPRTVRKPDVSLVLRDRLPAGGLTDGMFRIRPDFVAEVISKNEEYEEVDEKLADYFDAGVPLVWVLTPKTRTVLVYRADGTARRLTHADELTGDPIIPGFRVRVAELFPPPAPENPPA